MGAAALSAAGTLLNFFAPAIPIALFVNAVCLVFLLRKAMDYTQQHVAGFDPVVASEGIVAFGVFALVLGLASIGARFVFGLTDLSAGDDAALTNFFPFIEGLITAGFAPLFAIFLRLRIAEMDSAPDAVGDIHDLSRATADLTRQMLAAKRAIDTFGSGADAAGRSTAGLASAMKSEADKWGLALQEGRGHVQAFGNATREGGTSVAALAAETSRLKAAAADAGNLLEELARLIASVERFVAPASRR